jgi:hypothetical protein
MDDELAPQPLVFAHKVIKQFVDHSFGEGIELSKNDYTVLRLAFRYMHGSWEQIWHGNPAHMQILKAVISNWGQTYAKPAESDDQGFI